MEALALTRAAAVPPPRLAVDCLLPACRAVVDSPMTVHQFGPYHAARLREAFESGDLTEFALALHECLARAVEACCEPSMSYHALAEALAQRGERAWD